jgi:hypothetical protein
VIRQRIIHQTPVPTIYLDTSHLSVLSRARALGEAAYSEFEVAWNTAGATLVFTRTHLIELRQHGDAATRVARYDLLERLLPIQSDVVTREPAPERPVLIQEREVLRALRDRGVFDVRSDDPDVVAEWRRRHLSVFPERWTSLGDVAAARTFEDPVREHCALHAGCDAERGESERHQTRRTRTRVPARVHAPLRR